MMAGAQTGEEGRAPYAVGAVLYGGLQGEKTGTKVVLLLAAKLGPGTRRNASLQAKKRLVVVNRRWALLHALLYCCCSRPTFCASATHPCFRHHLFSALSVSALLTTLRDLAAWGWL